MDVNFRPTASTFSPNFNFPSVEGTTTANGHPRDIGPSGGLITGTWEHHQLGESLLGTIR